jgi:hypothetical protein
MSDDRSRGTDIDERAVSGHPDLPPQPSEHTPETDRELFRKSGSQEGENQRPDEEEEVSGKAAPDGEGGSDRPGTTLPGYG